PNTNPVAYYFASPDQIAFGPGAQSVVTPWPQLTANNSPCTGSIAAPGPAPINWNRQTSQGKVFQTATAGDINGDGSVTTLFGSNDWANVLYRFSAAIDFAGGRSETPFTPGSTSTSEMTKGDQTTFFLLRDSDLNLVGDGQDCGTAVVGTATVL